LLDAEALAGSRRMLGEAHLNALHVHGCISRLPPSNLPARRSSPAAAERIS
jgi:hypothetical protein